MKNTKGKEVLVELNSGVFEGVIVGEFPSKTNSSSSRTIEVRLLNHPDLKVCHVQKSQILKEIKKCFDIDQHHTVRRTQ